MGEHVDTSTAYAAVFNGFGQCCFIHDSSASNVDDAHGGFDFGERFFADHADCFRGFWHVNGDEVGLFEELVKAHNGHAHCGCTRCGDVGVVTDEVHAKGFCTFSDQATDASQAHDAQGLFVEFNAGEF